MNGVQKIRQIFNIIINQSKRREKKDEVFLKADTGQCLTARNECYSLRERGRGFGGGSFDGIKQLFLPL